MRGTVSAFELAATLLLLLFAEEPWDGDPSVPAADARRARQILAADPAIVNRSRIPDVKLLEIDGQAAIYLRTDRVLVERMIGEGTYDDRHSPADSIKLLVGGRCRIGGGHAWQDLTLLKIDGKTAVFHRDDNPRRGRRVEEVIAVGAYRDGTSLTDPHDPARYTYTEVDEDGKKRLEKSYRNDRLDGTCTTWHANGQKESESFYKHDWRIGIWTEWHANGQRRHEVTYEDDSPIGRELWWDANGRVSAIGEHPARTKRDSEAKK